MQYSDFSDILRKHKVWEFDRDKQIGFDEYDEKLSFIKTCGLCSTSCVFCGNALLLVNASQEGQCSTCQTNSFDRIEKMIEKSHTRTRSIIMGLYADINLVYHGDAFRGFFDYAIEHRLRILAHKTHMRRIYAESQRQLHQKQVLQKERMQALQIRKMKRPDNIRDILKPKPQTNTLMNHFGKL